MGLCDSRHLYVLEMTRSRRESRRFGSTSVRKKYGIIVSNLGHDRYNVMWYHGKIVPYSSEFMVKV